MAIKQITAKFSRLEQQAFVLSDSHDLRRAELGGSGSAFLTRFQSNWQTERQSSEDSTEVRETAHNLTYVSNCQRLFLNSVCLWNKAAFLLLSKGETQEKESTPKMEVTIFYNLISEVNCHLTCPMLLFTQTNPDTWWEGVYTRVWLPGGREHCKPS